MKKEWYDSLKKSFFNVFISTFTNVPNYFFFRSFILFWGHLISVSFAFNIRFVIVFFFALCYIFSKVSRIVKKIVRFKMCDSYVSLPLPRSYSINEVEKRKNVKWNWWDDLRNMHDWSHCHDDWTSLYYFE